MVLNTCTSCCFFVCFFPPMNFILPCGQTCRNRLKSKYVEGHLQQYPGTNHIGLQTDVSPPPQKKGPHITRVNKCRSFLAVQDMLQYLFKNMYIS